MIFLRTARFSVLSLTVVAWCLSAQAAEDHAHIHHAIHELKEAHKELKEADHDFGGHREKALKAVDAAEKQLKEALEFVKDPYKDNHKVDAEHYKKYKQHPHIHHAVVELKEAHKQLKEAAHDFGGHKEQAIKDIDYAVEQLELALKAVHKK